MPPTSEAPLDDSLAYVDHPAIFQAADAASVHGQRAYLRAVLARLLLALLAATTAAFTVRIGAKQTDIFAIVTMAAFVVALAIDVLVLQDRLSRTWYQGRALAESVKTLTWRYIAGGAPFPADMDGKRADSLFLQRIHEMRRDLPELALLASRSDEISEAMRALRRRCLDDRKRVYLTGRIDDQHDWYTSKALLHQRRATLFRSLMVVCEVGGVLAALAKVIGVVNFDLAGIAAAAVACLAAWSATRQHATNVNAFILATHELGLAREQLKQAPDETKWATAVADAEAAISREHSTWRSSHN